MYDDVSNLLVRGLLGYNSKDGLIDKVCLGGTIKLGVSSDSPESSGSGIATGLAAVVAPVGDPIR